MNGTAFIAIANATRAEWTDQAFREYRIKEMRTELAGAALNDGMLLTALPEQSLVYFRSMSDLFTEVNPVPASVAEADPASWEVVLITLRAPAVRPPAPKTPPRDLKDPSR